jgi:hypothetical protein
MIQFTKTNTLNNTEHRQRIHNNNLQGTPPPFTQNISKIERKVKKDTDTGSGSNSGG